MAHHFHSTFPLSLSNTLALPLLLLTCKGARELLRWGEEGSSGPLRPRGWPAMRWSQTRELSSLILLFSAKPGVQQQSSWGVSLGC